MIISTKISCSPILTLMKPRDTQAVGARASRLKSESEICLLDVLVIHQVCRGVL